MNRLLVVLGLIVVCVIAAGFYFGYFQVGSDSTDGKTHITLTVDQKKIQEDEKKALEKVHGIGQPKAESAVPAPQNEK